MCYQEETNVQTGHTGFLSLVPRLDFFPFELFELFAPFFFFRRSFRTSTSSPAPPSMCCVMLKAPFLATDVLEQNIQRTVSARPIPTIMLRGTAGRGGGKGRW